MYVELHAHSCYSLLDGASQPQALVARAAELGMAGLALTDHNAVYGVHSFIEAARDTGIRPVVGAELTLEGGYHLTLLVKDQAGWHNLCYLISRAQHNAPKGEAVLPAGELAGCTQGLIALSGCRQGEIGQALLGGKWRRAYEAARRYRTLFGADNLWIELQNHRRPDDGVLVSRLADLAESLGLGCVATNNVHYAERDGHRLQDVLVCIRHNSTLDQASRLRRFNSEYYLKSPQEMAALFADYPQAVANSVRLAEQCAFAPSYGLQDLPLFETPNGMSAESYLRRLCEQGVRERCAEPTEQVQAQLQRELDLITRARLANYFLIVWDVVRYARENGIRCQGRGSAANSLAAFALHISPIDPLQHDLVFERFLSEERLSADAGFTPDIDLDFDAARREEVIQYVYGKYGAAHVAMACTFSTYRRRSAWRDVGKAMGLSPQAIASVRRSVEEGQETDVDAPVAHLVRLVQEIERLPRHVGIHAGGMIITGAPLMGRVPTEPATMPGRVVVQWDKEGLESAGLIKLDILGLRMLSAIGDALALVEATTGEKPDLERLRFDDEAIYEMMTAGDTIGIFQLESRAQTQLQPVFRPRYFNDLIISISLIRPGPVQGNMVHPFLRRRRGLEPVTYAHAALEGALSETLGVILFQEQVLKVARDLAGFTPGQGEQLRRALGAKQATEAIEALHDDFVAGAQARGVTAEVAETVFAQLKSFGGYSFAKSHACAFAVLVYQSAWLKYYYPAAHYTALLNNQPMGFWTPSVIVGEAKRRGVAVLPVRLHRSEMRCVLEEGSIRLGFNYVKGLGEGLAQRLLKEREVAPFQSLHDFWRRVQPGRRVTENLIVAGAMDGWGLPRRHLLWELGTLPDHEEGLALDYMPEMVQLPDLTAAEALLTEQSVQGVSAGEHIMTHLRPQLPKKVLRTAQVAGCGDGQRVQVAGLLVVHQSPPTARGVHFLTLEDEEGLVDVVVWPQVYGRYRRLLHGSNLLLVEGVVQQKSNVTSLLAERIVGLHEVG